MKPYLLLFLSLLTFTSFSQDAITVANNCYSNKNYECAAEQYTKVLSEKKYKSESYTTILYRLGFSLGNLKRNEEAVRYFKDAITAKSDFADAYWGLGWVYKNNMGQYTLAVENYTKAISYLSNDPKSLKSLYYARGDSYYSLKKDSLALQDFIASLKLDSTNGNAHIGAGNATYSMAKYKDAAKWYEKSIKYGDTSKAVMSARHYLLGQSHFKQSKYEDALVSFKKSLEIKPDYGLAQWQIAAVYYNQYKQQDAIREYNKTKKLYADDTASMKQLHYWVAKCYSELKDYTKGVAELDAALKIDPYYRDAMWEKAAFFYKQKKYKEAAAAYSKAIQFTDDEFDLVDLLLYRGKCYLKLKDTASAKVDFWQALDYDYGDMSVNTLMGNINFAESKYNEARINYSYGISTLEADSAELSKIYFRKGVSNINSGDTYFYTGKDALYQSIKYDSINKEAHRHLADAHYRGSLFNLSEDEMNTCIRLYKNDKDSLPVMFLYRGVARSQQKKYKQALEDYEQSDKLKKFIRADYVQSMGQLAFEVKEYTKAVTIFTRMISLCKPSEKNDLLMGYYSRGRSSLELKKKEPAIADLNKALELAPGNAEIKGWLDKAKAL